MTDLGFGRDTWCVEGLRSGRYASGVQLVAQNAYHRLTTPRGSLPGGEEEADYGIDLPGMVGSVVTDTDARALEQQIASELGKDARIGDVTASVIIVRNGPSTEWIVRVVAMTDEGPFDLTIKVDEVTATLVGAAV
jgi:hypothetical protein